MIKLSISKKIVNVFILVPVFGLLYACTESSDLNPTEKPVNFVPAVNILSLATSDGADLLAPWNAQDTDLLSKARALSGRELVTAVTTNIVDCAGGGTVTNQVDNQGPPWFSEGDVFSTIFDNCIRGNTTINGQRSFSVDVMQGQQFVDPNWALTTTMSRNIVRTNGLTGLDSSAIGEYQIGVAVTDDINFVQNSQGGWSRTNFNNGENYVDTVQFDVNFTWIESPTGTYSWDFSVSSNSTNPMLTNSSSRSLQTLSGPNYSPPESGAIEIIKTLANVTSVTVITAIGNGAVFIESDVDGDGIIDNSGESTWAQIMLDPLLYQFF